MITLTRCCSIGGQHWIKTHIIYLLTIGLTWSIHSAGGILCDKMGARDGRSGFGADHGSFLSWRWRVYYFTITIQFHNFMATRLFWDVTHFYLVFNIFLIYFYKSNLALEQSLKSCGEIVFWNTSQYIRHILLNEYPYCQNAFFYICFPLKK